jgi:hypothetical protein
VLSTLDVLVMERPCDSGTYYLPANAMWGMLLLGGIGSDQLQFIVHGWTLPCVATNERLFGQLFVPAVLLGLSETGSLGNCRMGLRIFRRSPWQGGGLGLWPCGARLRMPVPEAVLCPFLGCFNGDYGYASEDPLTTRVPILNDTLMAPMCLGPWR